VIITISQVFDRYHKYLQLHDFVQKLNVTLPNLEVVIKDPNEELLLMTSENYTLTIQTNSAILQVSSLFRFFSLQLLSALFVIWRYFVIEAEELYNLRYYVQADTVFGAMRGLETFSQLVNTNNYSLPTLHIEDYPRYKFRGFMLDTSRHYLSVGVLKQLIRAASWSKLNVFHWHIVDDPSFPYCSVVYPDLCRKGAFSPRHVYSQSDVLEIILFSYKHGVIVVPELDTPGHTLSWGASLPGFLTHCPGKGNIGSDYGPINPSNEAVYPVLKKLFTEITNVFPSEFVHLGGDEVHYGCWKSNQNLTNWMTVHNISGNYEALEDYYETRLLKLVNSLNKNYIVWEEIYNHHLDITPETIIHAWLPNWKKVFQNATSEGYRCILSACWYLNRISYGEDWKKFYKCDPRSFNVTAPYSQQQLVLGGTICMWGEYVDNTNVLHRTWPRASAPAERLWAPEYLTDVKFMEPRIEAHRCRMVYRGYPAEPTLSRGHCHVEYTWATHH